MEDTGDNRDARFTTLYERHYGDVLRYAARRAGPEAAAEVAAETFLTAWRRLDDLPASQPLPWLYVTARHCLANEFRKQERRQQLDARIRTEAGAGAQAGHADAATLGSANGAVESIEHGASAAGASVKEHATALP